MTSRCWLGKGQRQQHADSRQRQAQHLQAFHARVETFHPVEAPKRQPQHQRDGDGEAEVHLAAAEELIGNRNAMGDNGCQQPAALHCAQISWGLIERRTAPARAPEVRREREIQGRRQQMQ